MTTELDGMTGVASQVAIPAHPVAFIAVPHVDVSIVQVYGPTVVAVAAAVIAFVIGVRQWLTAQQKVNLDLFQRRMVVYEEVHNMVVRVANKTNSYREDLEEYDNAVKGARWLFDLKIAEELDLLRKSTIEHSKLAINHSRSDAPPLTSFTDQIEAMLRKNNDVQEVVTLDALFDPFMRIGNRGMKAWLRSWVAKREDRSHLTLASERLLKRYEGGDSDNSDD